MRSLKNTLLGFAMLAGSAAAAQAGEPQPLESGLPRCVDCVVFSGSIPEGPSASKTWLTLIVRTTTQNGGSFQSPRLVLTQGTRTVTARFTAPTTCAVTTGCPVRIPATSLGSHFARPATWQSPVTANVKADVSINGTALGVGTWSIRTPKP